MRFLVDPLLNSTGLVYLAAKREMNSSTSSVSYSSKGGSLTSPRTTDTSSWSDNAPAVSIAVRGPAIDEGHRPSGISRRRVLSVGSTGGVLGTLGRWLQSGAAWNALTFTSAEGYVTRRWFVGT